MPRPAPVRLPVDATGSARRDDLPRRGFSAEAATATLVYLGPVVRDVRRGFRRVARLRRLLDSASLAEGSARRKRLAAAHQQRMTRLAGLVDEVQAVGAQLRDFEAGAIAFPSDDEGVPAGGYLSWLPGEAAVCHAHGPDEPTEARRPLRRKARRRAA
ncbi:DUF2203 family protein [Phycisphaera mikurensis]|uniref:Uncharacterized protein n=1 Tax=Phycisphaera mikurensis (strain NBRC 102666 / KCTC 22515 / FYK2301M01) TaxID=1142394 RepID=I0ID95_PHYMF|nr:DUF2203 family protein [Phycisphaera mikurensis]MBB6442358.1 hypothetical protein [Phycisphaera mikurensis]BAM03233.1 hypothetical protein PSMK_10740 [Phycisphaera mikurensis NBRC 102666]